MRGLMPPSCIEGRGAPVDGGMLGDEPFGYQPTTRHAAQENYLVIAGVRGHTAADRPQPVMSKPGTV